MIRKQRDADLNSAHPNLAMALGPNDLLVGCLGSGGGTYLVEDKA